MDLIEKYNNTESIDEKKSILVEMLDDENFLTDGNRVFHANTDFLKSQSKLLREVQLDIQSDLMEKYNTTDTFEIMEIIRDTKKKIDDQM